MGLPRYLRNELRLYMQRPQAQLVTAGVIATVHAFSTNKRAAIRALFDADKAGVSKETQVFALLKWFTKERHAQRIRTPDELTREKQRVYVGLEHRDDEERPAYRYVDVPHYCRARLERENDKKEERDRQALALREQIAQYRKRAYSSRTFPATLKAIIFERDNYTCKVCLRDRTVLLKAGLHLQCDHILAWEDGGQTTYDNGQTICSACNKAKHHAKAYLGLLSRLQAGPGR